MRIFTSGNRIEGRIVADDYLPLETFIVLITSDEHLAHVGLAFPCHFADPRVISWNVTPTDYLQKKRNSIGKKGGWVCVDFVVEKPLRTLRLHSLANFSNAASVSWCVSLPRNRIPVA